MSSAWTVPAGVCVLYVQTTAAWSPPVSTLLLVPAPLTDGAFPPPLPTGAMAFVSATAALGRVVARMAMCKRQAALGAGAAAATGATVGRAPLGRGSPTRARMSAAGSGAAAADGAVADDADGASSPPAAKRTAVLIFNPVSGTGDGEADLKAILAVLEREVTVHVVQTTADCEPGDLARTALDEYSPDVVIASGGDGTVGAVASALIGREGVVLGVIPRGTANALSAALGIPTELTDAAQVCLSSNSWTVDVGRCNGVPFLLLVGIGYEADVVQTADREMKRKYGPLAYMFSAGQRAMEHTTFEVHYAATADDGRELVGTMPGVAAVTAANAAPWSSVLAQGLGEPVPDDGLLEVMAYTPETGLDMAGTVANVFFSAVGLGGSPDEQPVNVHGGKARKVKLDCIPPQKVVLDGEMIGETPVEIELERGAVRLLVDSPELQAAREHDYKERLMEALADKGETVLEKVQLGAASIGSTVKGVFVDNTDDDIEAQVEAEVREDEKLRKDAEEEKETAKSK